MTISEGASELLRAIRGGAATRAALIERLGWSRVTLGKRLDELAALGLIVEAGLEASRGGRPATSFVPAADAGRILALDIGGSHSRVGVADFTGALLERWDADLGRDDGPDAIFAWARSRTRHVVRTHRVLAVGAGMPCVVDERGRTSWHDDDRWRDVDVVRGLGLPQGTAVAVDRDVSVLAIAEARIGAPGVRDLVVVKAGLGIGVALIAGGAIRRGAHGEAGTLLSTSGDGPVPLEDVASGRTVLAAARHRMPGLDWSTSTQLVERAAADAALAADLDRLGARIGDELAPAVAALDPEAVLVGGNLAMHAGLVNALGARVRARLPARARDRIRVERSRLAHDAGLLGAALIALDAHDTGRAGTTHDERTTP